MQPFLRDAHAVLAFCLPPSIPDTHDEHPRKVGRSLNLCNIEGLGHIRCTKAGDDLIRGEPVRMAGQRRQDDARKTERHREDKTRPGSGPLREQAGPDPGGIH